MSAHKSALVQVANGIFGDGKSKPSTPGQAGVKDLAAGHDTPEAAAAAINKVLSF